MTISNSILQVLVFIFMCVSCAPIPVRHYYPDLSSGGVAVDPFFVFNEDIPRGIRFTPWDIRISIFLDKYEGKKYIEVHFKIPEGKTIELKTTSAQVFWDGNNQPVKAAFQKISRVDTPIKNITNPATQKYLLDIKEPMIGERMKTKYGEWDKNYWLASYLEVPDADEIRIILPEFTVNEERTSLPELRFHKKWIICIVGLLGMYC